MVRLVFRPYTHVRRTICTSASLRASTRVSSGFTLHTHSSPSFGSQRVRFRSNPPSRAGRHCGSAEQTFMAALLSLCTLGFNHPDARVHVGLLGPCFKTGRIKSSYHYHLCTRNNYLSLIIVKLLLKSFQI